MFPTTRWEGAQFLSVVPWWLEPIVTRVAYGGQRRGSESLEGKVMVLKSLPFMKNFT